MRQNALNVVKWLLGYSDFDLELRQPAVQQKLFNKFGGKFKNSAMCLSAYVTHEKRTKTKAGLFINYILFFLKGGGDKPKHNIKT